MVGLMNGEGTPGVRDGPGSPYTDASSNSASVEIRAKHARLKQREGPKMVVIGDLQLLTSGKRVESRQQEVGRGSGVGGIALRGMLASGVA